MNIAGQDNLRALVMLHLVEHSEMRKGTLKIVTCYHLSVNFVNKGMKFNFTNGEGRSKFSYNTETRFLTFNSEY